MANRITPDTSPTMTRSSGSRPKIMMGRSSVLGHDFRKLMVVLRPGSADFRNPSIDHFSCRVFRPFPHSPGGTRKETAMKVLRIGALALMLTAGAAQAQQQGANIEQES